MLDGTWAERPGTSAQRILDHLNDEERAATVRAFEVVAEHTASLIDAQGVHEWPVL
jgi:hypothetical protein